MKNFVILFLSCLLFACHNQEKEEITAYFNLSADTLFFNQAGGILDIYIETNTEWHIISELPSWISFEKKSDNHISFIATNNNSENLREHQIIFTAAQKKYTLLIKQNTKEKLLFKEEKVLYFDSNAHRFSIKIETNVPFEIKFLNNENDWISESSLLEDFFQTKNEIVTSTKPLTLKIKNNLSKNDRKSIVVIYNNIHQLSDTLTVYQYGNKTENVRIYADGEYFTLQQADKGCVNLIIMGDGFTSKDLKEKGTYEQAINKAFDYFFSIEPYASFRNYFNVYMIIAESPSEGIGEKWSLGTTTFHNKFDTAFGNGTEIVCNSDLILKYARKIKELPDNTPITVIVVLNSDKYAGTTYLFNDGNSIALCPMSTQVPPNDFEGLIHHEAGGHGFAFLCDEYIYYNQHIPESAKQEIKEWQQLGFQMNLDFTDNLSSILWKDFIEIEKYKNVGAYEGGSQYQYGVWRAEENSCMNNNIPYFNVQSRWCIVKRIMDLSGLDYSIQEFILNDNPTYQIETKSQNIFSNKFKPLGKPILIKKNF